MRPTLCFGALLPAMPTAFAACNGRSYNKALKYPNLSPQMNIQSPQKFDILFSTNLFGGFSAHCQRNRAPAWADRIFNLALNGYYDSNYFFRVVDSDTLHAVQFGTGGNPDTSAPYNFEGEACMSQGPGSPTCGIILPQPNAMPVNVGSTRGLSNTYGTLSMSTSYNESTGTTWNATAELFINTGDNSRLDPMLFVPICTISQTDMKVVVSFPSFGEVQELGGPGPSISKLYSEGNSYIESNPVWSSMAMTTAVRVSCSSPGDVIIFNRTCGPCSIVPSSNIEAHEAFSQEGSIAVAMPYDQFDDDHWQCPMDTKDTCS